MAAQELVSIRTSSRQASHEVIREHAANELIFAVVGHVGSGTSKVAKALQKVLDRPDLEGGPCVVEIVKARDQIERWGRERDRNPLPDPRSIESATVLQDWGDEMRAGGDHAAVARVLIREIRSVRARQIGQAELADDEPVMPDGKRRAYILDAIRHPAEVQLLRSVYQNAFTLIGVVCDDEEKRVDRLAGKFADAGKGKARDFMTRDAKAPEKHGQRVSDAFHLADFFLDNSADENIDGRANRAWDIPDQLSRLVKIITHAEIIRPTQAEVAMYEAYGAQMRSACLSRQVGAALVDAHGNIVATGTNEVPRAGGGVYGELPVAERGTYADERCAKRAAGAYCRNTREQNQIIDKLIGDLDANIDSFITEAKTSKLLEDDQEPGLRRLLQERGLLISEFEDERRKKLIERLRKTRIGELLEFSRAVHAEMDALLAAARKGVSTVGARLFVTTFPCHYCARHVVAAGVDEVQYIEPYPKSQAFILHDDAITSRATNWAPPSSDMRHERGDTRHERKVLFHPFTGVAPRMFRRAFLKEHELKNPITGDMEFGEPSWATPWHLGRLSYAQLEVELSRMETLP
jgi:deoxycytidylate deaminase